MVSDRLHAFSLTNSTAASSRLPGSHASVSVLALDLCGDEDKHTGDMSPTPVPHPHRPPGPQTPCCQAALEPRVDVPSGSLIATITSLALLLLLLLLVYVRVRARAREGRTEGGVAMPYFVLPDSAPSGELLNC